MEQPDTISDWMSAFGNWAIGDTEAAAETIIKAITQDLTPVDFLFTFIVVSDLAGNWRGVGISGMIQTELLRALKNPHVAIWTASILFSAIHIAVPLGLCRVSCSVLFLGTCIFGQITCGYRCLLIF